MMSKFVNQDMLNNLTGPVLLTRGTEDIVMPEAGTNTILNALPQGETSVYEDTGHLPFFQHTTRFNQELAEFVDRVNGN